jgi:signal transduction histidine kinase
MSSKQPDGRLRSIFSRVDIRLTIWFTLIFLIASLLLFGLTFVNLYQTLREQERRELQNRALGYVLQYRRHSSEEAGFNYLFNEVSTDIQTPSGRPFFAQVVTQDNRLAWRVAPQIEWESVDFDSLLAGDEPHDEGFVVIEADQFDYDVEVLGVVLSDRFVLQLGAATDGRTRVLSVFQRSFLLTFLAMLGFSAVGGLFFASRSLRPIGSLNAAIKSIVETGQLHRRIPETNARDDLDDMTHSFNDMLDRIERLVNSLRDALDAVAHDLRTPLTRLRNTAERAILHETEPARYRDALSDAMEESEHILGMLNSMMDISEAESGAMNLHRTDLDLASLAREVADVYAIVAEDADMEIRVTASGAVPVAADSARIRQVIGNLYDNAVKYGRNGTVVAVECRCEQKGSDQRAEIRVTNEGGGIDPEDIEHVWTRLYRGRADGSRRDGLGLGLALVKAIVEAHQGSVSVESSPGEQTTFVVSLPSFITKL